MASCGLCFSNVPSSYSRGAPIFRRADHNGWARGDRGRGRAWTRSRAPRGAGSAQAFSPARAPPRVPRPRLTDLQVVSCVGLVPSQVVAVPGLGLAGASGVHLRRATSPRDRRRLRVHNAAHACVRDEWRA